MSEALELSKPLYERVYERIRDSIGDLMTDEDLKKLVDQAAQKAFFEPQPPKTTGYGARPEPPFLVEKITELLETQVRKAADEWIKEHPEEINKIIDEQLGNGFTKIIASYLDAKMYSALHDFGQQFKAQLAR